MRSIPGFDTLAAPEHFAPFLQAIADQFNEAASELASAWQDDSAGAIWADYAKILERAAQSCERARAKRGA